MTMNNEHYLQIESERPAGERQAYRSKTIVRGLLTALFVVGLTACGVGSDSGAESQRSNQVDETNSTSDDAPTVALYVGDPPANQDVQLFKNEFWEKLRSTTRCGGCHADSQAPYFVNNDDVNAAHSAAEAFINRNDPEASAFVSKMADGHNCWAGSSQECADRMAEYITAWVNPDAGAANVIELRAPNDPNREPGTSKNFPDTPPAEYAAVHTLLTEHCSECHTDSADIPISPYFGAADIAASYAAAQDKISLDVPGNSRLVVRLSQESHNCWSNCPQDANDMLVAITAMANAIDAEQVDPELQISRALTLDDGMVVSSGGRYENNVIALYEFKTGSGSVVYDSSDFSDDMNLQLQGTEGVDYEWIGGWGIRFMSGRALARAPSTGTGKLYDNIVSIGEYSVEAWVAPGNVTQEDAVIAGYMLTNGNQNFALKQNLYDYEVTQRSSASDQSGEPAISTLDADEVLQATLQHVVLTFDPVNGRQLYVNGALAPLDEDDTAIGNLANWDSGQQFILGNDPNGQSAFEGVVRLVAVHNRALTADQVLQNYDAGVGERFFLLFNVSHLVDVADSYIVFEVSQFDSYSYLFSQPFFATLGAEQPQGVLLENMRIGINGREATVGQAYANISTSLDAGSFNEEGRQYLSGVGTLIPLEKGTSQDEFFLSFDRIGSYTYARSAPAVTPPTPSTVEDPQVDIGLRTFDEINASMAEITGIPTTNTDVAATFTTVKQQLPTVELMVGFLSAHQMAVTQLAIKYCAAMVDDQSAREAFFGTPGASIPDLAAETIGGSPFNANDVTDAEWESWVIDPLLNNILGQGLVSQPDFAEVRSDVLYLIATTEDHKPVDMSADPDLDLDSNGIPDGDGDGLPDGLAKCGGNCNAGHTSNVVKAACASVLGSAALLVQ